MSARADVTMPGGACHLERPQRPGDTGHVIGRRRLSLASAAADAKHRGRDPALAENLREENMRRLLVVTAAMGAMLLTAERGSAQAPAAPPAAPPLFATTKIADNVYMFRYQG